MNFQDNTQPKGTLQGLISNRKRIFLEAWL